MRPNATPITFVRKLKQIHKDQECLIKNKLAVGEEFGIKHYAANVTYDANNFIVRNKDSLADDLVQTARKSSNTLIRTISSRMTAGGLGKKSFVGQQRGWLSAETTMKKFQKQLRLLFKDIDETKTRFVRCIKPNKEHLPLIADHKLISNQLKSAGLVTAIQSASAFFPERIPHHIFILRFGINMRGRKLSVEVEKDNLKGYVNEMAHLLLSDYYDGNNYAVGNTRVYFRGGSLNHLESERKLIISKAACSIQAFMRMLICKSKLSKKRKSSIKLQSSFRRFQARKKYHKIQWNVIFVQSFFRAIIARRLVRSKKRFRAATIIQARYDFSCYSLYELIVFH